MALVVILCVKMSWLVKTTDRTSGLCGNKMTGNKTMFIGGKLPTHPVTQLCGKGSPMIGRR